MNYTKAQADAHASCSVSYRRRPLEWWLRQWVLPAFQEHWTHRSFSWQVNNAPCKRLRSHDLDLLTATVSLDPVCKIIPFTNTYGCERIFLASYSLQTGNIEFICVSTWNQQGSCPFRSPASIFCRITEYWVQRDPESLFCPQGKSETLKPFLTAYLSNLFLWRLHNLPGWSYQCLESLLNVSKSFSLHFSCPVLIWTWRTIYCLSLCNSLVYIWGHWHIY